jgi:hypothetical protein
MDTPTSPQPALSAYLVALRVVGGDWELEVEVEASDEDEAIREAARALVDPD